MNDRELQRLLMMALRQHLRGQLHDLQQRLRNVAADLPLAATEREAGRRETLAQLIDETARQLRLVSGWILQADRTARQPAGAVCDVDFFRWLTDPLMKRDALTTADLER